VRGNRDLRSIVLAAAVCAVGALILPVEFVRLLFAAPLALFLPGYAIALATLARRSLQGRQLVLIGVALSLSVLALGALLLNYLGGLHAGSWALFLFLVVFAASRAAALRREKPVEKTFASPLPRPSAPAAALGLVGVAATVVAFVLAFTPVAADHAIGYSELWIRPSRPDAPAAVSVGVGSQQHSRTAFGLIARFGKDRRTVTRRFSLDPGERRLFRLPADRPPRARPERVAVTLYRRDRPNVPYRRVSAWIPGTTSE
jgi:hypothetical protein